MKVVFDSTHTIGYKKAEGALAKGRSSVLKKLKKELKNRVQEAWIFGSYATNNEKSSSDLDLIIITETDKKFHHRIEEFEDLYKKISPDLDIFIYTKIEFESFLNKEDSLFWREIKRDKIKIL